MPTNTFGSTVPTGAANAGGGPAGSFGGGPAATLGAGTSPSFATALASATN